MKTEPTETDREAARLFDANCRGLRVYLAGIGWCIVSTVRSHFRVEADAIDTDDPATVGVMLAQVDEALDAVGCPGAYLHPWAGGWAVRRGTALRRYPGPTKGAALVAAMKALKSAT